MQCPTIADLPPPPEGKSGWPWTVDSPTMPAAPADRGHWPRISVTTPSYQQSNFLEETIRSILLQGYPDLEYLVIDGGSTDGSVEIIKKYEPWLTYWVSKPDNGQSSAINEGWARSTGEIIAWLNSDDTYQPGALATVAGYCRENPGIDMVYGDCRVVDENSQFVSDLPGKDFNLKALLSGHGFIPQPATFIKRTVQETLGALNEDLFLVMDWDYWLRISLSGHAISRLAESLANFRVWPDAKSSAHFERWGDEKLQVLDSVFGAEARPRAPEKYRREAYRSVHNLAGKGCYKSGIYEKALNHYLDAFRYAPFAFRNMRNLRRIFKCYLRTWKPAS